MKRIAREQYVLTKCPYCGGEEFVFGYQAGYGAITGDDSMLTGTALRHQICRACGSVVRSFVDEPDKLLKRRDRKCDSINI